MPVFNIMHRDVLHNMGLGKKWTSGVVAKMTDSESSIFT